MKSFNVYYFTNVIYCLLIVLIFFLLMQLFFLFFMPSSTGFVDENNPRIVSKRRVLEYQNTIILKSYAAEKNFFQQHNNKLEFSKLLQRWALIDGVLLRNARIYKTQRCLHAVLSSEKFNKSFLKSLLREMPYLKINKKGRYSWEVLLCDTFFR